MNSSHQSQSLANCKRPRQLGVLTPLTFLTAAILLFASLSSIAETGTPVRTYSEEQQRHNYQQLLNEFGQHKQLPPGYELQALLALSHFPDLKNIRIKFRTEDVGIPLSSRPHWSSLLRSAKKRRYEVIIDTNLEGAREALLLKNQPFNAQIGILGHELSHTQYYLDRSFFQILADAFCQLNNCRLKFERDNDARLIEFGLGWQRYDHSLFVRRRLSPNTDAAVTAEGGGGAYMSPAELLARINDHHRYTNTENLRK